MSNLLLSQVQDQIFQWRARKHAGEKMPAELWQSATEVAVQIGAGKAAKELGLDFYQLRERCGELVKRSQAQHQSQPIHVTKLPPVHFSLSEMNKIEIENSAGVKLRLAETSPFVLQVIEKFFSQS